VERIPGLIGLWGVGLAVVVLLAGCAAPPAGSPAAAPSAPSQAASGPGGGQGGVGAQPEWQGEWERTLAAARQEGAVALSMQPGAVFRDWVAHFERKYPGIAVEMSGMAGPEAAPRILAERRADQYLRDLHFGGAETANGSWKPEGALQPLKSALVLPEVLDDGKWLGGFDEGFADVEGRYTYAFSADVIATVFVNRDFVSEAELSRVEDLVNPQWRGRMSLHDPRGAGKGAADSGHFVQVQGEDWWRQLLAQEPVVTSDRRQQIEWAVRGRYPVGIAISNSGLPEFHQQGVGQNIVPLAFRTPLGARLNMTRTIVIFDRPPHPNAAKLLLNWMLSREGQQLFVQHVDENSRRTDVDALAESKPDPRVQYPPSINKEAQAPYQRRAMEIAREIIR
jgi:ABC-type Fe3+ transport system substrate-binding protein